MKIEIRNATKTICSNKVLDGIYMTLESGNVYGFAGHNGSGKTMLLRAISRLIKLTDGEIIFSEKADAPIIISERGGKVSIKIKGKK